MDTVTIMLIVAGVLTIMLAMLAILFYRKGRKDGIELGRTVPMTIDDLEIGKIYRVEEKIPIPDKAEALFNLAEMTTIDIAHPDHYKLKFLGFVRLATGILDEQFVGDIGADTKKGELVTLRSIKGGTHTALIKWLDARTLSTIS